MSTIKITRQDQVAIIAIENPPVNALSRAVRRALLEALRQVRADVRIRAVVLCGMGKHFCAGADIEELADRSGAAVVQDPDPNGVIAAIESLGMPVVAAMQGATLGGGLELALGCHFRIASVDVRVGLPEISLGVLPGAGGTQRLPRLVGASVALKAMLKAEIFSAREALELGIVDALAHEALIPEAVALARRVLEGGVGVRRVRDLPAPAEIDLGVIPIAHKVASKLAAECIARCVEAAARLPFDDALEFEREQFLQCNRSAQAAALQHAFFAQRVAPRVAGLPRGTVPRPIATVGVVGGGTMGRGIAMTFADAGYRVRLVEDGNVALERALEQLRSDYKGLVERGRLNEAVANERIARVDGSSDLGAVAPCDLVIEAVFENLEVKRTICNRLGLLCKEGAIIATNTSTLDVDVLAEATGRPEDVVGLHFFTPANVMRLLEVVRGRRTAYDVLAASLALASRIGKTPVVAGVCYGFIGNRMLEGYLRETEMLLLEGVSPRQIDMALEAFGMAMGPCRMMDLAGVDVCAKVVDEQDKQGRLPTDPTYRVVCRTLAEHGRQGRKTGSGFYRYDGRTAHDDERVRYMCAALAAEREVEQRDDVSDGEIVERCLLPLINEGARILDEGIAQRASDIDVVWLLGYGFPAALGGPMYQADVMGTAVVLERLASYAQARGDRYGYWTPARGLIRLAESSRRFTESHPA